MESRGISNRENTDRRGGDASIAAGERGYVNAPRGFLGALLRNPLVCGETVYAAAAL
jgi:hypothetical protein